MKKKHFFILIILGISIFIAIPIIHLVTTKLHETDSKPKNLLGYTNDESHLNLTQVDTIIHVINDSTEIINQLKWGLKYATKNQLKVSIAGAKHSMGGHTMSKNGVVINMLQYKNMKLDTNNNILTIGAGALWEDALQYLDQFGKSISIMQAFNSFSIGGSLSVNGHGWQKNLPPISSSVLSFSLMKENGEIVNCSRTENSELFKLVLGGYGLFGIILDVKLQVVDNIAMEYKYVNMSTENYLKYYNQYITNNDSVELVFGRLRISNKNFLEETTLNFFTKSQTTPEKLSLPNEQSIESKRLVFRGSVNSEYGKRLRWDLEKGANKIAKNTIYSRNELLNDHVSLIENKDTTSTDILHEYFIPERNFLAFIHSIKPILLNAGIDLLNITIRRVERDHDTYMNYAKEPVYGFVILFNQQKTDQQEEKMIALTNKLVDSTIDHEGTFYLPYRLHINKKKMKKVYPQTDNFFKLKLKYDPQEIFSNKFYEHYK